MRSRGILVGVILGSLAFLALVTAPRAAAAPLTPGNLLVSHLNTGQLTEYTPSGAAVQGFLFPDFEGGFHDLRDIVVGPDGNVHGYNGTFTPQLSTLDPAAPAITSRPFAGWSTANNVSYGGIGAIGDGVFVTDMATAGAPEVGVVRFSTSGGPTGRFGPRAYTDLTIGGDGQLYALTGSTIDVFNTSTNALLRTVTFAPAVSGADVRGIAVAADGTIYAAGWNGSVYAVSATGALLNSRTTGTSNLTDIDLNDLGQLLVGGRFGNVILTDVTLVGQTGFTSGTSPVRVAFTTPLTVPEPAGAVACAGVALCFAALRRRR